MTEHDSVRFGGTTIKYQVRRSNRRKKTVHLTMDDVGVQVTAPAEIPDDELRAIVRKRAPWILGNASDSPLEAVPKRFVSGETLPYLGRNVRMFFEAGDVCSPEVRFDHWRFRITVPRDISGDLRNKQVLNAIVAWFRGRAAVRVQSSVDKWWTRLGGADKPQVLIRSQRQRWGSCAPDGTLRFNWRVSMLEPSLLEYIVVHELIHLRVKNHSTEFWGLVSRAIPDAQQRRRRLKEAGKALPVLWSTG